MSVDFLETLFEIQETWISNQLNSKWLKYLYHNCTLHSIWNTHRFDLFSEVFPCPRFTFTQVGFVYTPPHHTNTPPHTLSLSTLKYLHIGLICSVKSSLVHGLSSQVGVVYTPTSPPPTQTQHHSQYLKHLHIGLICSAKSSRCPRFTFT